MEYKKDDIVSMPCKITDIIDAEKGLYAVTFDIDNGELPDDYKKTKLESANEQEKEECYIIASGFIAYKKKHFGNIKAVKTASVTKAMEEIWKLVVIDGYDLKAVRNVLRYGCKDDFWGQNLLVLTTVRKKCKNQLTKFEMIKAKYDKSINNWNSPYNDLNLS